jgi:glycerol-3-phosphate O-acyltransferase
MLMLPSLMAAIITQHRRISRQELLRHVERSTDAESRAVPALEKKRAGGELDKLTEEMRVRG